jgi:hypothetical protein
MMVWNFIIKHVKQTQLTTIFFYVGWTGLHYAAALGLWRSLQFLTSLTHCQVDARTNHGLRVEDCPESDFGRRKCKSKLYITVEFN